MDKRKAAIEALKRDLRAVFENPPWLKGKPAPSSEVRIYEALKNVPPEQRGPQLEELLEALAEQLLNDFLSRGGTLDELLRD